MLDGGNFVTKVIYLPDPKYQELAVSGVETLVSTRLEPGIDPILEADKRGTILLIVRLGAIDLEMPGSPVAGAVAGGPVVGAPIVRHACQRPGRRHPRPRYADRNRRSGHRASSGRSSPRRDPAPPAPAATEPVDTAPAPAARAAAAAPPVHACRIPLRRPARPRHPAAPHAGSRRTQPGSREGATRLGPRLQPSRARSRPWKSHAPRWNRACDMFRRGSLQQHCSPSLGLSRRSGVQSRGRTSSGARRCQAGRPDPTRP